MTEVPRPGLKRDPHEDLRIAESQISAILTIAADAIISLDERFRITLFNEGATAIFGYMPDEIIGQPLDRLIPDRFRTLHHRHVANFDAAPVAAPTRSAFNVVAAISGSEDEEDEESLGLLD